MLRTRLLSAAVMVALLFWALTMTASESVRLGFFCAFLGVAGAEYLAMSWHWAKSEATDREQPRPSFSPLHFILALAYVACFLLFAGERTASSDRLAWASVLCCPFLALLYFREKHLGRAVAEFVALAGGLFYLVFPTVIMYQCLQREPGQYFRGWLLYFAMAIIFMGDTGAYFVGRLFGKNKLIPSVSPKKTVEGSIGGLAASVLTAVGLSFAFGNFFPWWFAVPVGLVTGAGGQMGDLLESAFKRASGVKDSSHLIPGHGGVLDRIDSLLTGVPIFYAFVLLSSLLGLA